MTLVRVLVMFALGSVGKVCCRPGACQKLPSFRCRAIGHGRWLSRTTALRMARIDFGRLWLPAMALGRDDQAAITILSWLNMASLGWQ